jgi:hypothetical protein
MKRYLRITFSAACGIACLMLIVLWARSYWWFDQFIQRISTTDYVAYTSFQGQFSFGASNDPMLQRVFKQRWTRRGFRMSEWDAALQGPVAFFPASPRPHDGKIIHWPRYSSQPFRGPGAYTETIVPYWLPCLLVATFAAWPWFKWPKRFSLRTLLIAMTLVAVVLD